LKIVLGLGNPGARYRSTRHNLGFSVVDLLAERHGASFRRRDEITDQALVAELVVAGQTAILAKPRTYMNRSGRAGLALHRFFDLPLEDLLVAHDDADLPLGRLRIRRGGSAGGHNGIRSLIATLGSEEFPRIKLGVRGPARGEGDLADYVLEEFAEEERGIALALVALGADAVDLVLREGVTVAMNLFNGKSV
jgi:PTH1 family peptidyl-tRNA hydrolase